MAIVTIPLRDYASYRQEVVLDGETFFIMLSWNTLGSYWSMSLENVAEEPVLSGVPLIPNVGLLAQYRARAVPRGELVVIDPNLETSGEAIGREDFFNSRALQLTYIESGSL